MIAPDTPEPTAREALNDAADCSPPIDPCDCAGCDEGADYGYIDETHSVWAGGTS